jgi:hypothetical protein
MQNLLIGLCLEHTMACHVVGNIVMIELPRLETVLTTLPPKWRIVGLAVYTLNGYSVDVVPEYNSDFGDGVMVTEALARITGWPRDKGLWIAPTLTDWPPLWPAGVDRHGVR